MSSSGDTLQWSVAGGGSLIGFDDDSELSEEEEEENAARVPLLVFSHAGDRDRGWW